MDLRAVAGDSSGTLRAVAGDSSGTLRAAIEAIVDDAVNLDRFLNGINRRYLAGLKHSPTFLWTNNPDSIRVLVRYGIQRIEGRWSPSIVDICIDNPGMMFYRHGDRVVMFPRGG
jgi:hypothetical protein